MMKNIKTTTAIIAALSMGIFTPAVAQDDAEQAGIPYEITFNGSLYPADLETVEYPYSAASQQRSGECSLNIASDAAGNIASMSIVSCSDATFENAATRYVNRQAFAPAAETDLTAHSLHINWAIGADVEKADTFQVAAR